MDASVTTPVAPTVCATPPRLAVETSDGSKRLEYIDGLRAVAALWVVVHHCLVTQEPEGLLHSSLVRRLLFPFYNGELAVMVFLVLSGFCLYYPLARRNPESPEMRQNYWEFMKRRARRILPPYFAAGTICVALVWLWPPMSQVKPGLGWASALPVTWGTVLSHALMLHNLIPGHLTRIDYPMWSIGLEWQLYLFFPVFVWMFRQRQRLAWLLVFFAITAGTRTLSHTAAAHGAPNVVPVSLFYGPWGYCLIFALGMQAAQWTVRGKLPVPSWALALGALACLGPARNYLRSDVEWAKDVVTAVGTVCLLLLAARRGGVVARTLSHPWLVKVGLFSYSLYLLHGPVLHVCWLALRYFGAGPDSMFLGLLLGGLPASVLVSYLFFLRFELPFIGAPRPRDGVQPA